MDNQHQQLVLASGSASRCLLLENAGLTAISIAPNIDEDAVKRALQQDGVTTEQASDVLADMKAQKVAQKHGDSAQDNFIIASDQMLDCNGQWFDKPVDRDQAFGHLTALSGKTHTLVSTTVLYKNHSRIWHKLSRVDLSMRELSQAFIADYLDQEGDAILETVGAYRLEGRGAQLFDSVDGDYFTILGLPLIELLAILRLHGLVPR